MDQVEKHLVLAACRIQAKELEGPANRVQEKVAAEAIKRVEAKHA